MDITYVVVWTALLFGGTKLVEGEDIAADRTDISPQVRSILQLLLNSYPALREHLDETNLGKPLVFLSTRYEIVSIDVNKRNASRRVIDVAPEGDWIVAVDYDAVDDFVYWSTGYSVKRMKVGGEGTPLTQDIYYGEDVTGIAVDWVARNIYLADETNNRIAVSRLNGSMLKTLIGEGIDGPRGIVVDPERGTMYWSEWKSNPRIASAALDGSGVHAIVDMELKWPNGLTLDYYRQQLFFADAGFDKIERVNVDGTGRKVLTDTGVGHIYGLSYLGGYLYFTDWITKTAVRMDVSDTSDRNILASASNNLLGIKATYLDAVKITNPCAVDNGGCSHLCFFTGKIASCGCPDKVAANSSVATVAEC